MSVWLTALGVLLSYVGCVLLFQGGERRARHRAVRVPKAWMARSKAAGWALVLIALVPLSIPRGLEIGVTVWLSILALAGVASLLVSALVPRWHLASPLGVAGLSLLLALPFYVFGGPG